MRRLIILVATLAAFWFGSAPAQDLSGLATLDPAASGVTDAGAGLAVDLALSQRVPFRVYTLDGPPRLVVDFREVDFGATPPSALNRAKGVKTLNWGRFRPGWSRIVAELSGYYRLDSAEMATAGSAAAVLRLRLSATDKAGFGAAAQPPDDGLWALPEPAQVDPPKRRQTGDKPLLVVLDPGHGGIDPGAEADGQSEKVITLTFARELAEALRRSGMDVILTRGDDVFVPLETRISVARAAGADVFVSLHADALAEGEAAGTTIYKLAKDAGDEASAKLAERHDRADILAGVDLRRQDDEVAGVLMDMARVETAPRTDRLADALAGAIAAAGLKMHRHPVQGADFSVLKSADIPSVLIELGFLSSAPDRRRLDDPVWRAGMQQAILSGLSAWAAADAAEARLLRQ